MTQATITVYRNDDEDEIEVTVEGRFENVSSYNRHECGSHLYDWRVVEPKDFRLTGPECDEAEQALYDNR